MPPDKRNRPGDFERRNAVLQTTLLMSIANDANALHHLAHVVIQLLRAQLPQANVPDSLGATIDALSERLTTSNSTLAAAVAAAEAAIPAAT